MDLVDHVLESWRAERPDLDFSPVAVVGRLQRVSRLLDRAIHEFSAARGLEQWEVDLLFTLRRAGEPYEMTAGALMKSALVTSGAITNRVDRMEEKNLVVRVADRRDRRSVRVKLTPHGRHLADTLIGEHLTNEEHLLRPLSSSERETLTAALRTLLLALGDTPPQ